MISLLVFQYKQYIKEYACNLEEKVIVKVKINS